MRLLLDTHTFLWFVIDSPQLSPPALSLIKDPTNQVILSVASVWELAIKVSVGKISLEQPIESLIPQQILVNRIDLLSVDIQHAIHVATLPLYHRDPFDRLLIAQAMVEQIPVISADSVFDRYAITRLW